MLNQVRWAVKIDLQYDAVSSTLTSRDACRNQMAGEN
jgi:hypothetical protein